MSTKTFLLQFSLIAAMTVYVILGCNKKSSPSASSGGDVQQGSRMVTIQGSLKFTYSYCGGARPSDEMLKRLETPRAVAQYVLYLKSGSANSETSVIDSASCNEEGRFSFRVTPGNYTILIPEQCKPFNVKNYTSQYIQVDDKECLRAWWEKGLYSVFAHKEEVILPDTVLHQRCDGLGFVPCTSYSGPLRPVMRRE